MARPVWHGPGDTLWEEHRKNCELEIFHCHIGDQLYYSPEEVDSAYPDGLSPLDQAREWIQAGFITSLPSGLRPASDHASTPAMDLNRVEHKNHVHVSLISDPKIQPGDLVTFKDGRAEKAKPGTSVGGIVVQTTWQASGGGEAVVARDVQAWIKSHRIENQQ